MKPYRIKLPLRLDPYSFTLMADAYWRHGIIIDDALEIERRTVGQLPRTFTQYIIHGPKKQ